ncbi:MAG TPA: hypothetical protein VGD64_07655 [Acidisarcina sp.]
MPTELPGRPFSALIFEPEGTCIAVIDGHEIWRRAVSGVWVNLATSPTSLQSVASMGGILFGGGMEEASIVRITGDGRSEHLTGFDLCPGRQQWFAGGPPLGVRSLTATADGAAIIAAVHVGGLPRSIDGGATWRPSVPIRFDVHEVRAHPTRANVVAAAAAVGLCVSNDGGETWAVISEGLGLKNSLALAVLQEEVLFTICDGPFAKRHKSGAGRSASHASSRCETGFLNGWTVRSTPRRWHPAATAPPSSTEAATSGCQTRAQWAGESLLPGSLTPLEW